MQRAHALRPPFAQVWHRVSWLMHWL
jgi:hypothetical protein